MCNGSNNNEPVRTPDWVRTIIMITLGIGIGFSLTFFLQNCSSMSKVEKRDNKKFEELKKNHANDSVVTQKVTAQLYKNLKEKNIVDSVLLHNTINSTVRYNLLADSILYQTKIFLLEKDIDDIRQETNNVINKYNGLLSLWIAIITVVGGVIPWIVFFRIEDRNNQRNMEMEQRFTTDSQRIATELAEYKTMKDNTIANFDKLEQKISTETKDIITNLKNDTDKIRKEIENIHNQYTLETDKNKIINVVFGITSSANPSINKCSTNREELTKLFLGELANNLKIFIGHIKKIDKEESGTDFSKEAILVLFQIEFGVIKSQTIFTKIHLNRELSSFHNTLRNALDELLHQSLLADDIINHLDSILASLYAFVRKI